ncbi:beta strand repeat-containing protein, partial [Aquimarina sp. 433]
IEIEDANADAGSIVGSPIASLAPGASVTVTANQTITQADIDAGFIENSATATGDSPSGTDDVTDVSDAGDETVETPNGDGTTDGETDNDPTVTDLTADPSLSVIKTIRVVGSALNDVIEYDIVVTNTGNVTLTDIEITDDNADAGSIVGSPIASLAPGTSVTVTANQTITQADIDAGFIENSATATGDSPSGTDDVTDVSDAGDETVETPNGDGTTDGETDNDPTVTDLTADPSLSVIKTVRVVGSALNDVIEYDIVVTNTGNVTLTDIEIEDANADTGSIVGSPIASLAPGVSVTVTANQTITQADIDAGFIENSATATGDSPSGTDDVTDVSDAGDETVETPNGDGTTDGETDNDPTVTDLTADPSLSVIKTVRVAGSALNDVIEYDIVVTNTGNVTLTDIEIEDANADAGSIVGSPIVSLAPGASVTVTANQTITQADMDAGFIENSATATGDSPSGTDDVTDVSDAGDETVETPNGDGTTDGETDNDPTVTDLIADPDLTLVKTGVASGSNVGDVITYTFTVTNTGNVTVSNIFIDDILTGSTNLAITPSTLAPGEQGTAQATYVITQVDINNGEVINSATVIGEDPNG